MIRISDFITVSQDILSGTPVFRGTRVPVKTLFDHVEAGDSLDVFLEDFPAVTHDVAVAVLEEAHHNLAPEHLQQSAHSELLRRMRNIEREENLVSFEGEEFGQFVEQLCNDVVFNE